MLPRVLLFAFLVASAHAIAHPVAETTASEENDVPRRAEKSFGVTLETGWKNYAGMAGVGITWHVRPRLSLQLGGGAGFSFQPRVGSRIR